MAAKNNKTSRSASSADQALDPAPTESQTVEEAMQPLHDDHVRIGVGVVGSRAFLSPEGRARLEEALRNRRETIIMRSGRLIYGEPVSPGDLDVRAEIAKRIQP